MLKPAKYAFSLTGIAAWQNHLGKVANSSLRAELQNIQTDFLLWLNANFQLSAKEEQELIQLSAKPAQHTQQQITLAMLQALKAKMLYALAVALYQSSA